MFGWWDGKQVKTDKYLPPKTEQDELEERRKERAALLKKLEKKKLEMAQAKEQADQVANTSSEVHENVNEDEQNCSSSLDNAEAGEKTRE